VRLLNSTELLAKLERCRSVVPKVVGTAPLGALRNSRERWSKNGRLGGGEAEMGGWGAIGDQVSNYISVVLLTLSDQMS